MNNNPTNQQKIIVKRLERKPRQNYVKTLASLKNIVEYLEDISSRLIRITDMKNLEEKERLLYYLKVEITLETLHNEKYQKRNVSTNGNS